MGDTASFAACTESIPTGKPVLLVGMKNETPGEVGKRRNVECR